MPITRRQAARQAERATDGSKDEEIEVNLGEKRHVGDIAGKDEEPPSKKNKTEEPEKGKIRAHIPQIGTVERGHVYFFYRPRVQHQEAHSIDDVKNLHMLLIPRSPRFSSDESPRPKLSHDETEDSEMTLLAGGADAVPSREPLDDSKKKFRLITIGKKTLPNPGAGKGRKETFWGVVTAVGDDLDSMERGLGEKTYETKTRGTRHEEPARLAGRGAYAIVNNDPSIPSKRETHLGYYLSHPAELGEVQKALGIYTASSFVLQIKNPLAPATGSQRVGLPAARRAKYPEDVMRDVFGKGTKGRQAYGLRFASCEDVELLDYEGAELLLIAARGGVEGLEKSLGDGRGEALHTEEECEKSESINEVFRELALNQGDFPADALKGEWI